MGSSKLDIYKYSCIREPRLRPQVLRNNSQTMALGFLQAVTISSPDADPKLHRSY